MTPSRVAIYVAVGSVDLRRSFDGLAELARQQLRQDPMSGALFLFFNRAVDRVKTLWWDRSGYCILYKRLERSRFAVPVAAPGATHIVISAAEFAKLLDGMPLPASAKRTG
jgi:transposase